MVTFGDAECLPVAVVGGGVQATVGGAHGFPCSLNICNHENMYSLSIIKPNHLTRHVLRIQVPSSKKYNL